MIFLKLVEMPYRWIHSICCSVVYDGYFYCSICKLAIGMCGPIPSG